MRTLILTLLLAPLLYSADEKGQEFFEMRVRPVLAKNCFACHTASRMGGRVDILTGSKRRIGAPWAFLRVRCGMSIRNIGCC